MSMPNHMSKFVGFSQFILAFIISTAFENILSVGTGIARIIEYFIGI